MIDLHCHSFFSDGVLSPEALIQRALKHHLICISLTDHDTLNGYPDFQKAALGTHIKVIKGIELSVRWNKYDIHILGYQMNHTSDLDHLVERQTNCRIERAIRIGHALSLIGIEDAYHKACTLAGHERIGRLHFAHLLVREGKAKEVQSAFKQFLRRGKPAYIPSSWISLEDAVSGIVALGGRAVIAHPLKYGLTRSKLHELIKAFKDAGGAGIEVVSGTMSMAQILEMAALSTRFDLLASSGSDFHGDGLSGVNLGRQSQLPVHCKPIWYDWNIEQGII